MRKILVTLAISVAAVTGLVSAADKPPVPYPTGYRDWRHVKSMVINPGHGLYDAFGGIHHLYANKAALCCRAFLTACSSRSRLPAGWSAR